MFRVSISGKANSGKNTLSRLIAKELKSRCSDWNGVRYVSFADPVKEMAMTMFPELPRKFFFGASKFRNEVIPGATDPFDGSPLTVRNLLIDLGTKIGRNSKEDIWLDNFDYRCQKIEKSQSPSLIVCPDQRFVNEWQRLKNSNFFQVRVLREKAAKLIDISETEQDSLKNEDYDWVVKNNGTKKELKEEVQKLVNGLIFWSVKERVGVK